MATRLAEHRLQSVSPLLCGDKLLLQLLDSAPRAMSFKNAVDVPCPSAATLSAQRHHPSPPAAFAASVSCLTNLFKRNDGRNLDLAFLKNQKVGMVLSSVLLL